MWLFVRWVLVLHTYFACVNVTIAVAIPQFLSPSKGNSFSILPFTETNRRQSAFYYEKNCVNGVCTESNSPNNAGGFENGGLGNGNFGFNRPNFGNGGFGNNGNLGNPNNNFGVNGLNNEHQSAFYYEKNCVNGVCVESNSPNRPNGGSNIGGLINSNFGNQQRPPFNNFNNPGEFNQQSSYYTERTCVNGHCTDKVYNNGVEQGPRPTGGSGGFIQQRPYYYIEYTCVNGHCTDKIYINGVEQGSRPSFVGGNNPTIFQMRPPPANPQQPSYPLRPSPTFPNNQSPTFPEKPSMFYPEMVDPSFNENPVTTSTTTRRPVQATPSVEECKESLTKVNGIQVKCNKALIFDSSFTNGLNRNWSHVVQMAEDDESEFTVFDRDHDNIYPKQGSLVIKPIFLDQKKYKGFVTNDTLDLTGRCTSNSEKECKKEAVGRIFLPPILSARITTERSFSFRYGRVEIKAKLPRGDWVVPEIWLLPKSFDFGRSNSGKIVLANALGNDDLKIGGADSGNKFFHSKLRVGEKDTTFKHKKPSGSFSDGYHLFQMLWTPDEISFGYDNELIGRWSTVSHPAFLAGESEKIAPFNQEFYLVLGVHVGGTHDFPDGSINRGKLKPWKNNEVARRKSFYDDSPNWLRTWDDNTALRIEYVKVWSL